MDKLTNFIKTKIIYKSSVPEDMLIGFAIVLAGYFYYYENKIIISNINNPQKINYAIKITMGVIIIITWLYLSFQNGVKKRRSFVVCTLAFWLVPQIFKYCVDTFDKGEYSGLLHRSFALFAKYLSGVNYLGLKTLGDAINKSTGIPYYFTLNSIIILFEVMFIIGFLVSGRFNDSENSEISTENK